MSTRLEAWSERVTREMLAAFRETRALSFQTPDVINPFKVSEKCEAAARAILERAAKELVTECRDELAAAVGCERLEDPQNDEDIAYDLAVDDCTGAMQRGFDRWLDEHTPEPSGDPTNSDAGPAERSK